MILLVAAAVAALVVLTHTAPFPTSVDDAAGARALWRVPPRGTGPTIYLTYDDGPNPTATPDLLDALDRLEARATFFVIAAHVTRETAPLVRRMFADGHGVALHSADRWLLAASPDDLTSALERAASHIGQLAGSRPCPAFRPHGGWRSARMYRGLSQGGYTLVGWSWMAWDWNWFRRRTGDSIARRVASRARDGTIAVVHDGHHEDPRANRRYAVEATEQLVPALRARGFTFGSICDVVGPAGVTPPPPPAPPRSGRTPRQ
jgi:peptidoglycan/xylan/chitin deacetylase (PgdA/CDA1 family)